LKKKVVVQLPAVAREAPVEERYSLELEALRDVAELVEVESTSKEAFIKAVRDADAILTSWGVRIDQEVIDNLQQCAIVGVGSVGVDMVDVDAATEAGIVVTNTPDIFIEEVADHTLMLLLACARRVKIMDKMVSSGDWYKGRPVLNEIPRLWGQTLGLISFGNVATAVARRAKPFGMHVIACDPYVTELKMTAEGVEPVSFEELLDRSDYVSVHPGLNDSSRGMLSDAQFAAMKDSAVVINCGRGPVIDEPASFVHCRPAKSLRPAWMCWSVNRRLRITRCCRWTMSSLRHMRRLRQRACGRKRAGARRAKWRWCCRASGP